MTNPNPEGIEAAREFTQWHLGSSYWADLIIRAYLNPDSAIRELRAEKAE